MTELKPILHGRHSRGMERLLGSARIDVPRPGGVARTVAALGLASGVTATAGVSAASASVTGASVIVKWLAVGAVAGAAVTGTGEVVRYRIDPTRAERTNVHQVSNAREAAAQSQSTGAFANARAGGATPTVPEPEMQVADPNGNGAHGAPPAADPMRGGAAADPAAMGISGPGGSPTKNAAVTTRRSPGTDPPGAPASVGFAPSASLAEEVRTLDHVRRLLAAGDAHGALESLDALAKKIQAPRLGPEAKLLRAQALTALGRDPNEAHRP